MASVRDHNRVPDRLESFRRCLRHCSCSRARLLIPPQCTMLLNGFEPTLNGLEPTVQNEKLDDVFETRTKPRATGRKMKRRHLMWPVVTRAGEEVSERPALAVHLDM